MPNRAVIIEGRRVRVSPRRVLLGVLAVVAALLPASASARGPERVLTITGTGHAFGVLTVTEETYYRMDPNATAEYGGRWAGFVFDAGFPRVWSVYDRHAILYGRPAEETWINGEPWGVLRPGRHRVYLFADGQPVTIRVPWTGPGITLALETPLDAHVEGDQVRVTQGGARLTLPQEGTAGTVTAARALWRKLPSYGDYTFRSCHTPQPASWKTCDRRRYRDSSTVAGHPLAIGGVYHDGVPRQGVTAGRVYFGEIAGVTNGVLTLMTVRYRPVAEDLRRLPL